MRLTNFNSRFFFVVSIILLAAASRLIVHVPNFTPVAAIALFGGAYLQNRFFSFFIPMAALLLSDLFLPYYDYSLNMLPVYGSYIFIIGAGIFISKRINILSVLSASLFGSAVFFLVTNFAYFYAPTMYPHNLTGVVASYTAGLPFFRPTLISDLCFNIVLFGGFYLAQLKFPKLSKI
jgi:hypothetical protein